MKNIGIIAEYNPFHEGHRYLIEEALKKTGADCVVSVMSGSFTQRGLPAVYDKWTRAEAAVRNGVNLVMELPVCYACSSAEYFAKGGTGILEGLGCIDYIAFGSECGDIKLMQGAASVIENDIKELHLLIQKKIKEGMSYPKARAEVLSESGYGDYAHILSEPNNILGVEYLRQMKKSEPVTVKRTGNGHHESATEIRRKMQETDGSRLKRMENVYYNLVRSRILQMSPCELEEIFSSGEGLGNKLINEVRYAGSLDELTDRVKSKAYTRTRISRLLTQTLLGITGDVMKNPELYARVLAFDGRGAALLKEIRKSESAVIPVITNINKETEGCPEIMNFLRKDILATDMYNIISGTDTYEYSDYVMKPVIL